MPRTRKKGAVALGVCRAWLVAYFFLTSALVLRAAETQLWVAVGDEGRRMCSADGVHWQHDQRWTSKDGPLLGIAAGLGHFVAVGGTETTGRLITSVDAQDWREIEPVVGQVEAIAFGQDRFVAVADHGRQLLLSTDGEKFTPGLTLGGRELPRTTGALLMACGDTEAGYRFVIIGNPSRDDSSATSWRVVTGDGTHEEHFASGGGVVTGLAYGAGHFVLVGPEKIESSHDGQTWVSYPCPGDHLGSIVWIGDRFLVSAEHAWWSSPDALTWKRTAADSTLPLLGGQANTPPLIFGQKTDGQLMFSSDLRIWDISQPLGPKIRALVWGGTLP